MATKPNHRNQINLTVIILTRQPSAFLPLTQTSQHMENFIFYSYLSSAIAYSALLLFALSRRAHNASFIAASLFSGLWSAKIAHTSAGPHLFLADTLIYETLRNASLFILLISLLAQQQYGSIFRYITRSHLTHPIGALIIFTLCIEASSDILDLIRAWINIDPRFFSHVLFAVIGLFLIEQLYRNTPLNQRWNLKFICLGVGALFVVDLIVYSKSLLYKQLDITLWQSRGIINTLITPLLAISLSRIEPIYINAQQSTPRKTVF